MIDTTTMGSPTIERLQRAIERLDRLVEEMGDDPMDREEARAVLDDDASRSSTKERALVALGLEASAEAEAALSWYDFRREHWRLELLRRLALSECLRRKDATQRDEPGRASVENDFEKAA